MIFVLQKTFADFRTDKELCVFLQQGEWAQPGWREVVNWVESCAFSINH